jgi:hypothetical protein
MAEKSVLELLANAPKSEVRTLPMSLPEQRGNPANLLGLALAEEQTQARRNAAKARFAQNRYLATGDKAKALGFTPQMSMQPGGQQSAPVSPMFEPGADVGAMTAALGDRPLLTPVLPEQQLTAAELAGHRYGPGYEGRYYQPGNVGAVENLEALQPTPVLFADGVSPPTAFLNKHPGLLADPLNPTLPANVQRAGIQTELLPPPPRQEALLEPVDPGLEPPSDEFSGIEAPPRLLPEYAPELAVPPKQQMEASALLPPEVPELLDRRQLMAELGLPTVDPRDLPPDIAYPGERVTPEAPPAVPITPVSTDGILPAPGVGPTKAAAGIVDPISTAKAEELLGAQTAQRIKPYIRGPEIKPEKTKVDLLPAPNPKAPNAQPNVAVPAVTKKNQVLAPIQKTINAELKKLQVESDPDSTMPFWNWLSDFSAGLRAAGKSGDQTVGAIAAGFANVRKGAKERAALAAAARTASIKNISELAGAAEDLASITGVGNFGGYGTAAGQFFKTPNLPRSGVVNEQMSKNTNLNLDLVRNSYTYKTDKQNNVTVHQQKLGELTQINGWRLDPKTGLPTGKPEIFTKGSPEYNKALETHTFTEPDEVETLATDADMKKLLGQNYERFKEKNSLIFVTRKAGQPKGIRIQNLPPGKWINLFNQETMTSRMVDSSIAGEVDQAMADGYTVRMNFQADTPPRSRTSMLRGANTAAEQSIALVDKLITEDDRRRAAGEVPLFGAIGGLKRTYQNFSELASDIGRSLPIISFMGRDATSDYMLGMTPEAQDNFDTMAAQLPIFKTMLVYSLAKARKQDNSRLNQFDVAQARKDIDKLGALTSSRDIRAGLLAVRTQFRDVISRNSKELQRIIGVDQGPDTRKPEGPEYESIVKQLKAFKAKDDRNMEVYIRRFKEMYPTVDIEEVLR